MPQTNPFSTQESTPSNTPPPSSPWLQPLPVVGFEIRPRELPS